LCHGPGDDSPELDRLFSAIVSEYHQVRVGRELMLQALINQLLVWLCRRSEQSGAGQAAGSPDRGREHLQRFMHQLEESFRLHWSIQEHPRRLGISAAQLNALCRRDP
ncbi:hypothetical protein, partial [Pandoraea sputorum]|uniref:hypothetical protein n=1 Tax=Pandoraea sputorum TaxID=93222 RepID=UPI0035561B5D